MAALLMMSSSYAMRDKGKERIRVLGYETDEDSPLLNVVEEATYKNRQKRDWDLFNNQHKHDPFDEEKSFFEQLPQGCLDKIIFYVDDDSLLSFQVINDLARFYSLPDEVVRKIRLERLYWRVQCFSTNITALTDDQKQIVLNDMFSFMELNHAVPNKFIKQIEDMKQLCEVNNEPINTRSYQQLVNSYVEQTKLDTTRYLQDSSAENNEFADDVVDSYMMMRIYFLKTLKNKLEFPMPVWFNRMRLANLVISGGLGFAGGQITVSSLYSDSFDSRFSLMGYALFIGCSSWAVISWCCCFNKRLIKPCSESAVMKARACMLKKASKKLEFGEYFDVSSSMSASEEFFEIV